MEVIHVIAAEKLQDASFSKEALLHQVIEKIIAVEAIAMQRLSDKLPRDAMQHLQERILMLKANAAKYHKQEAMMAISLPLSRSSLPSTSSGQSSNLQDFSDHQTSSLMDSMSGSKQKAQSQLQDLQLSQPVELVAKREYAADSSIKMAKRPSFLSRAKSFLGLPSSHYVAEEDYYPIVSFNQRGRTAGSAHLQRWEIRLNPILLAENSDLFIKEVIPHEYAHLLTFALYGRVQPHGREWQMMMTEIMQLPATRTHCFNTENSVTRHYERFTYYCLCQSHELTAIRHNRIQSRKARYFCKHCGESLERREVST